MKFKFLLFVMCLLPVFSTYAQKMYTTGETFVLYTAYKGGGNGRGEVAEIKKVLHNQLQDYIHKELKCDLKSELNKIVKQKGDINLDIPDIKLYVVQEITLSRDYKTLSGLRIEFYWKMKCQDSNKDAKSILNLLSSSKVRDFGANGNRGIITEFLKKEGYTPKHLEALLNLKIALKENNCLQGKVNLPSTELTQELETQKERLEIENKQLKEEKESLEKNLEICQGNLATKNKKIEELETKLNTQPNTLTFSKKYQEILESNCTDCGLIFHKPRPRPTAMLLDKGGILFITEGFKKDFNIKVGETIYLYDGKENIPYKIQKID